MKPSNPGRPAGMFVQQGRTLRVIDFSPRNLVSVSKNRKSRKGIRNKPHCPRKRKRMDDLGKALIWPPRVLLVTLGFDGPWPPEELYRKFRAYIARLERRWPAWGLRRLEFQGGPHFHLVVAGVDDPSVLIREGPSWWAEITDSHGCQHHVEQRDDADPSRAVGYILNCNPEDNHPRYGHLKSWGWFGSKKFVWDQRIEAPIPTKEGVRQAKQRVGAHHRFQRAPEHLLDGRSISKAYASQQEITDVIVHVNGVDNRREVPLLNTTIPAAGYVRTKQKKKKKCPPAAPCAAGDRPDMLEAEKNV